MAKWLQAKEVGWLSRGEINLVGLIQLPAMKFQKTRPAAVIVNQIRPIDRLRLRKRMGKLSRGSMARVDKALRISLGLIRL